MPARRAFGSDDGGASASAASASASAAAVASPSEEAEEEGEEEEAAAAATAPLSPLVVVVPPAAPTQQSSSSSGSGKKDKRRLGLFVASAALAHPDKAHYGGEDAWFCSPVSSSIGEFFLLFFPRSLRGWDDGKRKRKYQNLPKQQQNLEPTGIADGVGGWAESGVCPAEYARELMAAARAAAEGTAPALVTPASLAAARGAAGRGGGGPAAAAASGGGGSFPGVPIACFEAAGGGAPAPPHSSSSAAPPASATAAAAAGEGAPPSRGEHGGASPPDSPPPAPPSAPSPPPPAEAAEIPKRALAAAHAAVRLPGSATACVAALDPETGTLHGVSVGDAALLVARRGFVLFRSTPSSHSFDCPRQLAAAPEHVEWSDGVEDGEAFEVEGLEEGDVVLLGTDGVFDNCWAAELLALLPTEATPRANAGGGGGGDSVSSSSSSSPLSPSPRGTSLRRSSSSRPPTAATRPTRAPTLPRRRRAASTSEEEQQERKALTPLLPSGLRCLRSPRSSSAG